MIRYFPGDSLPSPRSSSDTGANPLPHDGAVQGRTTVRATSGPRPTSALARDDAVRFLEGAGFSKVRDFPRKGSFPTTKSMRGIL